jgi:hypothetical protein
MNSIITKVLLIIIPFIIIGCSKGTLEQAEIEMKYLHNTWIHAFEEQRNSSNQIYRPIDYKTFPSSWFRMKYIFAGDNSCQWLVLAADDGHYLQSGTWVQSRYNEFLILIYDSTGVLQKDLSFVIVDLQYNLLEIAPINL